MDPYVMVPIVAVVMTFAVPIFAIWTWHQRKLAGMQIEATSQLSAEKAAQYAMQNRDLEERLRVLERIVTDRGYDLAGQIEALREREEPAPQPTSGQSKAVN